MSDPYERGGKKGLGTRGRREREAKKPDGPFDFRTGRWVHHKGDDSVPGREGPEGPPRRKTICSRPGRSRPELAHSRRAPERTGHKLPGRTRHKPERSRCGSKPSVPPECGDGNAPCSSRRSTRSTRGLHSKPERHSKPGRSSSSRSKDGSMPDEPSAQTAGSNGTSGALATTAASGQGASRPGAGRRGRSTRRRSTS